MKGGPQVFEQGNPDWFADEGYLADRVGGLGTEVERPAGASSRKLETLPMNVTTLNQLSGDIASTEANLRQFDQHKKLLLLTYLRDKLANEKATKRESRSSSESSRKKKKHHKKHHKKSKSRKHHRRYSTSSEKKPAVKAEEVKEAK